MAMTQPKSTREWVVALICTVFASVCGGAGLVQWLDLHAWADQFEGMVALIGLCFVCGLPAWVFVRAWFAYADKRQQMTLLDMIKEIREALKEHFKLPNVHMIPKLRKVTVNMGVGDAVENKKRIEAAMGELGQITPSKSARRRDGSALDCWAAPLADAILRQSTVGLFIEGPASIFSEVRGP